MLLCIGQYGSLGIRKSVLLSNSTEQVWTRFMAAERVDVFAVNRVA